VENNDNTKRIHARIFFSIEPGFYQTLLGLLNNYNPSQNKLEIGLGIGDGDWLCDFDAFGEGTFTQADREDFQLKTSPTNSHFRSPADAGLEHPPRPDRNPLFLAKIPGFP
jgi:hypothetical protein